jgi:hypothetical protein
MKTRVINKKTRRQKELEKMLLVKNVKIGKVWRNNNDSKSVK